MNDETLVWGKFQEYSQGRTARSNGVLAEKWCRAGKREKQTIALGRSAEADRVGGMTTQLNSILDVPWAPTPNVLSMHQADEIPSPVTSVFAFVTHGDEILVVDVISRGLDLPGGKIDPGESVWEALRREVQEETGVVLGDAPMSVLGYLRLDTGDALIPENYPFPHPLSFMGAGHVELSVKETPLTQVPEEIREASWVKKSDLLEVCGERVWKGFLSLLPSTSPRAQL